MFEIILSSCKCADRVRLQDIAQYIKKEVRNELYCSFCVTDISCTVRLTQGSDMALCGGKKFRELCYTRWAMIFVARNAERWRPGRNETFYLFLPRALRDFAFQDPMKSCTVSFPGNVESECSMYILSISNSRFIGLQDWSISLSASLLVLRLMYVLRVRIAMHVCRGRWRGNGWMV